MNRNVQRTLVVLSLLSALLLAGCSGLRTMRGDEVPAPVAAAGAGDGVLVREGAAPSPQLPGFKPMLENEALRLDINEQTAEIAVVNKGSGTVWYSNPQDRAEDALAKSPYLQGKLSAQLSLIYLTSNGQNKNYDSYNDSISYGQYKIEVVDNGLNVTFEFGNPEKGIESTPAKLSVQRFEELLAKLDESDQEQLAVRYKLLPDAEVYERREIPKAVLKRFLALFEKAGYTEEDLAADNAEHGNPGEVAANPRFTVPVRYTLDGGSLIASVDTSQIVEESSTYRIHSISLLENFGAAGAEEQGYILLPDGSGALLELNSGRSQAQPILISMYGDDGAMYVSEKFNTLQPSRMPVFGMKHRDAGFLAVIEHGDGIAKLAADISGRLHGYNTVHSQYTVLPKDEVRLSNNERMYKTPQQSYKGQLQVRYLFLEGEQANYSGMAAAYRGYLEQEHGLQRLQAGAGGSADTPFYLELTGSIPQERNLLGFSYDAQMPLTTIEQADEVTTLLQEAGIGNIRLNYKGWFNKGLHHNYPTKVQLTGSLGSRGELQSLAAKLAESGGALYPDVAFMQAYSKSNGFKPSRDAAQYISRRYVRIFAFDRAVYFKDESLQSYYLVSPNKIGTAVTQFLQRYGKYGLDGLSLRDLGAELYSDFRRGEEMTREDAKRVAERQMERIGEQADLIVSGGNAYAFPYASHILNAPEQSNGYQLAVQSVPFYQMVLHGYIEYAGSPANLADEQDARHHILRALETGSNLYYSWIYANPSDIKPGKYSIMYANYYADWLNEAIAAYAEVNSVLKQVRGQAITVHEQLAPGVYRTVYENGLAVLVNYNDESAQIDGAVIQPRDYYVKGGM